MEEKIISCADDCSRSPKSTHVPAGAAHRDGAAIGALVRVLIDDREAHVPAGTTVLEAARSIGIRIPTLCYHEDLCVAGVCRICVVEVEGMKTLQAACAYPVNQTLSVRTHTKKVRYARRHILDLLLSRHCGECYGCVRNSTCELQALAREYGIDYYRFGHAGKPAFGRDSSSYAIVRDMDKCILCRRCVRTCVDMQEVGVYEAVNRGSRTTIGTFMGRPMADIICINCGQCINRCPTGALHAQDPSDEIWAAIDDPKKHVVIQTAPSPRAAIAECFGLEPGTALTFELNTALRFCGFDRVFDTNFAADLTIIEEGTELILRLYRALVKWEQASLPQFTSCSPGWVKFVEHFHPEMLDHLSTAKSPEQMFGSLIKTCYAKKNSLDPADIVTVALMPCTAKKFECNRPEMCDSGYKDIDYGLTTRELAQMIMEAGIELPKQQKSGFDDPFGTATGSGVIFGTTGGVMEAAIRTVFELITGERIDSIFEQARVIPVRGFEGIRYAELPVEKVGPVPGLLKGLVPDWEWIRGATLKVGIAHGTANARKVLEDIKAGGKFSQCHFIEFMACPGGCLGGGGMPIPTSPDIRAARARAIYAEDEASAVRKSHENQAVLQLYRDFLTDGPCGHISHRLLHTQYTPRGQKIV